MFGQVRDHVFGGLGPWKRESLERIPNLAKRVVFLVRVFAGTKRAHRFIVATRPALWTMTRSRDGLDEGPVIRALWA